MTRFETLLPAYTPYRESVCVCERPKAQGRTCLTSRPPKGCRGQRLLTKHQ